MIEIIALAAAGLLVIAAANVIGPWIRVAAPILLVAVGVAVSLLPITPDIVIDPEIILNGLLPPLLYASAVSLPAITFRRDVGPIASLSVPLVVVTAALVGLVFGLFVPDLGIWWAIALGAIVSPTDAAATAIIKGGVAPRRVVTILEGESLLNDATALVLLRTALTASVAGFSFWGAAGSFAYAVAVAVAVGSVIGWANVRVRKHIHNAAVNTIISFTIPFAASVPAELLGASGLVAAVLAGLITGFAGPRLLPPRHRFSDAGNWATVNLVLEGAVFLTMGLQMSQILHRMEGESIGLLAASGIAAVLVVVVLGIRLVAMVPLLLGMARRSRVREAMRSRVGEVEEKLTSDQLLEAIRARRRLKPRMEERFMGRLRRFVADFDYFTANPIGARDGFVVVWAGMRGAVTVAAVQTLPDDAPHRALLVFVAFAVAVISLAIQGTTIGGVARLVYGRPAAANAASERAVADRDAVLAVLEHVETVAEADDESSPTRQRIAVLRAQREALLDARDLGTVDADALESALTTVDAEQVALELRERNEP